MSRIFTEERLREAVVNSLSVTEVLLYLGRTMPSGSTQSWTSKRIKKYGIDISHFRKGNQCRSCASKQTAARYEKIVWPSTDEILSKLKSLSMRMLAKELGVSGNAIKKRLRNHSGGIGVMEALLPVKE